MNDSEKVTSQSYHFERYVWLLTTVWTIIITASLIWNVIQAQQNILKVARIQAQTAFEKDVIYRRWNAEHGGVYAPVTEKVQPNPYLINIPERDITTPLGKSLTLINPAYMTRQVHELAKREYGVLGHITSLNPIRPENAPDPWEITALQAFERGQIEISSIERMDDEEYMRLMRPLITEEGCLKCHAAQGYQEGDIRGGISVSIPMAPLWAVARAQVTSLAIGHVLLWAVGLGGIVLGTRQLRWSERERNQTEAKREALIAELENKNTELERFTYTVSHDLKSPLITISGFLGMLEQDTIAGDSRRIKDDIKYIRDGTKKMKRRLDDLLELSRIGRLVNPPQEVPLSKLAHEVADLVAGQIARQRVRVNISPNLPVVYGDPSQLREVLQNLVDNAVKYMGDQPEPRLEIGVRQDGAETVFYVQDNGIGIDPRYRDKVFGLFETLDRQTGNTGVGLAIVKQIIEVHGGRIWVESEGVGQGSAFCFTLPDNRET